MVAPSGHPELRLVGSSQLTASLTILLRGSLQRELAGPRFALLIVDPFLPTRAEGSTPLRPLLPSPRKGQAEGLLEYP